MKKIGTYEAKTNLNSLLDKVAKGEKYTITKHGVPIALLIPVSESPHKNSRAVIDEIFRFKKGRGLRGIKIKDLIRQGRKY